MATQYLSMAEARALLEPGMFADFCLRLEEFAVRRDVGLSVADAAEAIGIAPAMGERFELLLSTLLAVLKSETAPEAPGAAQDEHEGAHHS